MKLALIARIWRTGHGLHNGDGKDVQSYVDTHRMFARGEMVGPCKEALASGPKRAYFSHARRKALPAS